MIDGNSLKRELEKILKEYPLSKEEKERLAMQVADLFKKEIGKAALAALEKITERRGRNWKV